MIQKFYNAQKAQSLLFLVLGIFATILSIYFFIASINAISLGFAIPFFVFGLTQTILGFKTYIKTNSEREFVMLSAKENIQQIITIEIPRINKILTDYNRKNHVFLGLNALSIVLFTVFANTPMLKGIGLALFVQSLIHISSLYFENNRSQIYFKWLNDYYN
ncbi:MAG: hypothetical protein ACOVSR_06350 [Bacteroidia bacterium]